MEECGQALKFLIEMNKLRFLIGIFILAGCGSDSLEKIISLKASQCKEPCIISLREMTDFKWDKLYVFDIPSSLEEINHAIGVEYNYYEEFTRPIIFLYGGKIVYYENDPINVEGVINEQVIFGNATDTVKFKIFSTENAVFKVQKRKSNGKHFYELTQVK